MTKIVKRSLKIAGHSTSISLEEPFWRLLRHVAEKKGLGIAALVEANLSSAVRVHLLEWMMSEGAFLLPDETAGDLSKD